MALPSFMDESFVLNDLPRDQLGASRTVDCGHSP